MSGPAPVFGLKAAPMGQVIQVCNETASSVIGMIESQDAIDAIDDIASVDGVDVLLVGSSDLSVDLGIPGQFRGDKYRDAVEKVSQACRKNGRIFGIAGVYDNPEVQDWAVNTLGARFMLVHQDGNLIGAGASKAVEALPSVKS